jgi:hypothetical protein
MDLYGKIGMVFAKLPGSGEFPEFGIYFSIGKLVE